eukprot:1580782-Amphidinium_carterae.1
MQNQNKIPNRTIVLTYLAFWYPLVKSIGRASYPNWLNLELDSEGSKIAVLLKIVHRPFGQIGVGGIGGFVVRKWGGVSIIEVHSNHLSCKLRRSSFMESQRSKCHSCVDQ